MTRIVHLSDLHFGTENREVMQALLQLCRQLQPSLYLLSGDITQRARRSQFAAAETFVHQLNAPLLAVPGNHDLPLFNLAARLMNPYGNYRRVFGSELEPHFESHELLVIGVNTTRPARHKDGEVSSEQIERVVRRLRQASPGQLRVVMLHHPVRAIEESDVSNLLIGREQAIPTWVDAGMDLILAGHIHLPYQIALRGGERLAWAVQAGTGVSQRVRGAVPNSINLIDYQPGAPRRCQLARWDYDQQQGRFIEADRRELGFTAL
ncbi:MAG: metallophosphoesterase [Pseudomonas sp.]